MINSTPKFSPADISACERPCCHSGCHEIQWDPGLLMGPASLTSGSGHSHKRKFCKITKLSFIIMTSNLRLHDSQKYQNTKPQPGGRGMGLWGQPILQYHIGQSLSTSF